MKIKFNQTKYINDYKRKHYKKFSADLKIKEMIELENMLKELGITKKQFLLNAISKLKEVKK